MKIFENGFLGQALDRWFAEYGDSNLTISKQLKNIDAMQTLMKDLSNASLLVRNNDRYRFAHTSYLEFFRAIGLFESIRQNDNPYCFDRLLGNTKLEIDHQTLQFLINWYAVVEPEDREEFDQQFRYLLATPRVGDSNLAIRKLGYDIWRFAHLNEIPSFPHDPDNNLLRANAAS